MMNMVGYSQFGKMLDKATSQYLMEPDLPTTLSICDMIRQGDVPPKVAFTSLKKKLGSANPHTLLHSLMVLESIVKNCPTVHEELAAKSFLDTLHDLVKTTSHSNIRNKILELLQTWSHVFKNNSKFEALNDIVNQMKGEGFKFPALRESEAMFSATNAPTWVDGEACHRCRVQFNLITRKHHCRACGQVFCGTCTRNTTTLPKFGIEKEVRVCDSCYAEASKSSTVKVSSKTEDLPFEYLKSSLYQQKQQPTKKTDDELQEEEDLQMAIALSQSEAENKEKERERAARMKASSSPTYSFKAAPESRPVEPVQPEEEALNPELAKYLNRSYWESRTPANSSDNIRPTSPSAPSVTSIPLQNHDQKYKVKENGLINNELEDFINTLRSQVEIFINRMKSNSSRGRSIANDTSVQTLFMNITTMHSTLLEYIKEHDDNRLHFERLQDKLTQVKDARAALDALREEHRERLRREAEEAERLRQIQMAQKLEIMRKKKQEYLQYQRQLVLQRVQEQEREMQMRQEQQKQAFMGGQQYPMGYMVSQFPPNSAPPVGPYHQYGPVGPHPVMVGQGMMPGQPPQSAPPQMGHMGGPNQGAVGHQQMLPPNYNPTAGQTNPPPNPGIQGPPMHNQDPAAQQLPPQMQQQMGMAYPPQQMLNTAPIMSIGQPPNQNSSQALMGPRPGTNTQQFPQQPGAPPASPQVPQPPQQPQPPPKEETQTAELISFD
ncbi:hepatocyte growth factor-regulated tyrosine kinase substrate [Coccinella septempunctata]|uniref:hepatocyte growth factor-regulated tyrosine kinase substrate n=1 Tax=Coccinella septempunctata TaxID=41139 RepID=UPI001D07E9D8|nr:hepatocyte growth factor-regulated tyrosine kinase substrate [Coccinella septempunctata]